MAVVLIAGCRHNDSDAEASDFTIDVVMPLFAPAVGPNRLHVRLIDNAGNPLDNAVVEARADMTHAGMVPVLAEAVGMDDGRYELPLEWTMSGDWIVTVEAELPDGQRASRQFELTVTGENIYCNADS